MASRAFGPDSIVGLRLGHYVVVTRIGAGGMGEVYRARDEHLDRDVAIKVLPSKTFSDDSARKHFRTEALALSKLNHPNIATIHDFDTADEIDFLVTEYIAERRSTKGSPRDHCARRKWFAWVCNLPKDWPPPTPKASFIAT
jgi:serine/threonine protein kinase